MHQSETTVIQYVPSWLPRTATWIYNQVRFLPAAVISHVVCERTENLEQFPVTNIHCSPKPSRFGTALERWKNRLGLSSERAVHGNLVRVARRVRAGLVHSHWGHIAWRNLPTVTATGLPHVVTFYGKDVNHLPVTEPVWRQRYLELFQQVSLVLCEGPHMAQCIVDLGCPEQKVAVQALGIELDQIPFRPRSLTPAQPLRVLLAASFRQKKGIPDALRGLARLRKDLSNLQITIIGDAPNDARGLAEKEEILRVLRDERLGECTKLLGYQSHAALFEAAYQHDVFLSPSLTADDGDTEGGAPVTLIEMAATGMPVVSTTHCDIPSVVIHGETGLLAPERDPAALAGHLRWLVEHPGRWLPITTASRRHIERNFDVGEQARRLAEHYQLVCRRLPNTRVLPVPVSATHD